MLPFFVFSNVSYQVMSVTGEEWEPAPHNPLVVQPYQARHLVQPGVLQFELACQTLPSITQEPIMLHKDSKLNCVREQGAFGAQ